MVLKNINLKIPAGKITAIVGTSGSGKTTLVKLLLGFYQPIKGKILFGDLELGNINSKTWRSSCGAVLQDGHIFSDTIIENITVGDDNPDPVRLNRAVSTANIKEFIDNLPLGDKTCIGQEGVGISQGQKQRILIARAVYKNPNILFFDEATNALDSNNESTIMHNLNDFFTEKTIIIVAHRFSTVKNADQIIVLEKGEIVEKGNHEQLIEQRGNYFRLVKNQLELDN
jgi:ATP-binding cassette subfamily B protein